MEVSCRSAHAFTILQRLQVNNPYPFESELETNEKHPQQYWYRARARSEIMEKEAEFPVVRGGTFIGNPISCVAAKATINEIVERGLVERAADIGEHLKRRLLELAERHPIIGDIRGMGLLIGVELVKNQEDKEPVDQKAAIVVDEALKRGLMIGAIGTYNQTLRLTPPLILSREEANLPWKSSTNL